MALGEKMVGPFRRMQFTRHHTAQDVRLGNVDSPDSSNAVTDEEKANSADVAIAEDDNNVGRSTEDSDTVSSDDDSSLDKRPDVEDQAGIQRVEAITLTWSKKSLIAAYIL